jgi:hypothetical protein
MKAGMKRAAGGRYYGVECAGCIKTRHRAQAHSDMGSVCEVCGTKESLTLAHRFDDGNKQRYPGGKRRCPVEEYREDQKTHPREYMLVKWALRCANHNGVGLSTTPQEVRDRIFAWVEETGGHTTPERQPT